MNGTKKPNWAKQTKWATKPLEYAKYPSECYHRENNYYPGEWNITQGRSMPPVEIKSKWEVVPKVVIALSLGTLLFQLAFSLGVANSREEIRNRIMNANSTKIKIPELNLMLSAHQGLIIQKIELEAKDSKW